MRRKISDHKLKWHPLVAGSLVVAQWAIAPAEAHQAPSGWTYPVECCSDTQDCQTINRSDVTSDEEGYIVTLAPGEHRHAPDGGTFYMLDNQIRPSGDDKFHVCIHEYTNGPGAICLYIPHQGMSLIRSRIPVAIFRIGSQKSAIGSAIEHRPAAPAGWSDGAHRNMYRMTLPYNSGKVR